MLTIRQVLAGTKTWVMSMHGALGAQGDNDLVFVTAPALEQAAEAHTLRKRLDPEFTDRDELPSDNQECFDSAGSTTPDATRRPSF